MRRSRFSLIRRLIWQFSAVTLLAAALTTLAYALLKEIELEYELEDLAQQMANRVRRGDSRGPTAPDLELQLDEELQGRIAAMNALHLRVYEAATRRLLLSYDHEAGLPDGVEAIRDWPPGIFTFTLGPSASPIHEFGFIEELPTPTGAWVRIVARRGPPELRDYIYWLSTEFALELGPVVAVVGVASTILAILTVKRGFAPLARISAQAATIAPGQAACLDPAGMPEEILPLVEAINHLLNRLQDALAQQRRFTAVAAHELRTPLAALRARIDALPPTLPQRQGLEAAIERMARLVDQLLAVSRLEGGLVLLDEDLDLCELVQVVAAELAPLAAREDRELTLDLPPHPVVVHGNRDALARAIANLLDNAFRHTPRGTPVEVQVSEAGAVRVLDRGPGLSGHAPDQLFQPFARYGRQHSHGAGLGLAIVRDVARLHGGRVEAQDRPGGGAIFTMELPLAHR